MTHLLLAKKVRPQGSALFFLGNVAPDAVSDWRKKDKTHFRDVEDRQAALVSLAKKTDGDFAEGILMHLYFDWRWDTEVASEIKKQGGSDWLPRYRKELGLAGSYLFHSTGWAKQLWQEISSVNVQYYGTTPGASAEEVKKFVQERNRWHNENIRTQSTTFPPQMLEDFTTLCAADYIKWRKS
jgi:hypothetical protein